MVVLRRSLGAASLFAVLCSGHVARAEGPTGEWKAEPLRVSWAVGEWDESCGPRPSGGGEAGGVVTLSAAGNDFTLSGLGRTYSSAQCWERMPGLTAQSHSAGASTLRTTCKMPAADPRQASVVTTWSLRGDTLYFDETGQYQLVTGHANCTASARRTRLFNRVVAAAAAPATAPNAPISAPTPLPTAASLAPAPAPQAPAVECKKAGPPTKLAVSPKTKLMRGGDSFAFRLEAQDAKGCRANVAAQWAITSGAELGTISSGGVLAVPTGAPSGPMTIEVRALDRVLTVGARVVSAAEYELLLGEGQFGAQGESADEAETRVAVGQVGVETSSSEPARAGQRGAWLGLGTLAVLLVGLGAYFGLRRKEPALNETLETRDSAPPRPVEPAVGAGASVEAPRAGKVCPVCALAYPQDTTFCGADGSRLVRVN